MLMVWCGVMWCGVLECVVVMVFTHGVPVARCEVWAVLVYRQTCVLECTPVYTVNTGAVHCPVSMSATGCLATDRVNTRPHMDNYLASAPC